MRKFLGSGDEVTDISIKNDSLFIINNPIIQNVYSVQLTTEIGELKDYRELSNSLREAKPEDIFKIYINNFGGYLHTGIDIINSIKACRGRVVTIVTGPVYSMAPLIVLSAPIVFIENSVFMMFHDYSGGTYGKGHEQKSAIEHEKPFFDQVFKEATEGFLTKSEIKRVTGGSDLYLDREAIMKRLRKLKRLANDIGK